MKREFHVRFCERPKGRFLWPTRPFAPVICTVRFLKQGHHMIADEYSVLIDQTMLCEASRLIEGVPIGEEFYNYLVSYNKQASPHRGFINDYRMGMDWWPPTNSERLFHLSTLLDSIALYENICVLKAELPPDADTLKLRNNLIDSGIVQTIDTSMVAEPISEEFRDFLSSVKPGKQDLESSRDLLANEISKIVFHVLKNIRLADHDNNSDDWRSSSIRNRLPTIVEGLEKEYEGTLSHWWLEGEKGKLQTNTIATLGSHIIDKIGYYGSGAIVSGISHLRTFVYWRISDHLNIPFFPSCRRMPQFETISSQISPNAHQEVYKIIADAFKCTVEQVYEDCKPTPILVPPVTSIFLQKLKNNKNISSCLEEIRSEFKGLREALKKLQYDLRNSETMHERLKAKRKLKDLLEALTKHYEFHNHTILDEALAYAPNVLKPLSNPTNPEKYTTELVKKPIDWVREWWSRRPFRVAYKLRDRLLSIPNYNDLLKDSLAVNITDKESEYFQKYYDDYLSLYGQKKKPNQAN